MKNLKLRCLNKTDEIAHTNFIDELLKVDGNISPMAAGLREIDSSFQDWLNRTRKNAKGEELFDGWVPSTVMFLFRENDNKILGAIDIRHRLNDFLLIHGGNIGYGVAPSERRKGYASTMLAMALEFCKSIKLEKVLVTCNKDNIGSAKTIQKNGGVLENEFVSERDGKLTQRYWINL